MGGCNWVDFGVSIGLALGAFLFSWSMRHLLTWRFGLIGKGWDGGWCLFFFSHRVSLILGMGARGSQQESGACQREIFFSFLHGVSRTYGHGDSR